MCAPIIKYGRNYIYGPLNKSYNHLKGWQAVCRVSDDEQKMLLVVHSFEDREEVLTVRLPGECITWDTVEVFGREGISVTTENGILNVDGLTEYDAVVVLVEKHH